MADPSRSGRRAAPTPTKRAFQRLYPWESNGSPRDSYFPGLAILV